MFVELELRHWILVVVAGAGISGAGSAQCLELQKGFRLPGPTNRVSALESANLGDGWKLYAGGLFTQVDDDLVAHVASWDGTSWKPLGRGVDGEVLAIHASSDPSNPRLIVGGAFTRAGIEPASGIAAWDGERWSALGSGVDGAVDAIEEFDDGSGPALYAGGTFVSAGGLPASHVARWNGSTWSKVGAGLDGLVSALAVFDDGTGPALYAGGSFDHDAHGSGNIARWDGSAWSVVGRGLNCPVSSLCVFPIDSKPMLCAGGCGVRVWNGTAWSSLGMNGPYGLNLRALDDGTGLALYAGDYFTTMKWNGLAWSTLPTFTYGPTLALAVHDDGSGRALYVGGDVFYAPLSLPLYLGRFDGSVWIPVGRDLGMNAGVNALAKFDDGGGEKLFAAGRFTTAGSTRADLIARFDGDRWSALSGGGIGNSPTNYDDSVDALAVQYDGTGASLYAGGHFSTAGGTPAENVARWDGASWSALGSGVTVGTYAGVRALAFFDDGSGERLYVGGEITAAGGVPVSNIAVWDGSSWSDVGGGTDDRVTCMIAFDDGSGQKLFVGGLFTNAGGSPSPGVARWDGHQWSAAPIFPGILSFKVFDDGTGPALYAGSGPYEIARRWNGSSWVPIHTQDFWETVTALEVFDDGSGPELFAAAGLFKKGAPPLFRWDRWQVDLITYLPVIDNASSMLAFQGQDSDPALWVGLRSPAGYPSLQASGIAKFKGCSPPGVPFCGGATAPVSCPCDNLGAPGRGCANSSRSDGAGLTGSGTASLASDALRLVTDGELATSLSIVWQGDADVAPHRFGDGVTCVAGVTRRLYELQASAGSISVPRLSDPTVSERASELGDVIAPGDRRIYQVFYRDPAAGFCPPPRGSSFNTTNALSVYWRP
jgi:hypothetical protein